jgi:AAA+ superfamily predicted ATPase
VVNHLKDNRRHPGQAVIFGEEGGGKTAVANVLLKNLASEGVPIYRIRATAKTGAYFAKNPQALENLFSLAKINRAVIYLPDLEQMFGGDERIKAKIETQLVNLLKSDQYGDGLWVVAETASIGKIDDLLAGRQAWEQIE